MSEPMSVWTHRHAVVRLGNGPRTLMFAHGFGCDQGMWRHLVPAFENDYSLVLFDYIGSGRSDVSAYDPVRHATLAGYAEDVVGLVNALDLKDVVFVGHSASAMVGVLAAQMHPGLFSHMVMIGPSPCYINHPPDYVGGFERSDIDAMLDMMEHNFEAWADALAPVVMKHADRPELAEELEASFCALDPSIARRWARAIFLADNRADLPKVQIPSLVLQCSEDALAPLAVGDYIARHMPQSTVQVLRATGHCPHMSEPDEAVAVMRDYFRDQGI